MFLETATMDSAKQARAMNRLKAEEESTVVLRASSDSKKLQAAIAATADHELKLAQDAAAREAALAAVAVKSADVEHIAHQFDLTSAVATRLLRSCGGDFNRTLAFLVSGSPSP